MNPICMMIAGLILLWEVFCPMESLAMSIFGGESGRTGPPHWVIGESQRYPREQYLTGVGHGDTRKMAEDDAYATISRIFLADIRSTTQEWEEYLQSTVPSGDQKDRPQIRRAFWIDRLTEVSTHKILENVSIAEVWTDPKDQRIYALAVMDRAQSAAVIESRIGELDDRARARFESAEDLIASGKLKEGEDRLQAVRHLYGAFEALLMRESLNTDLKIIQTGGRGLDSPIPIAQVGKRLDDFLSQEFHLTVSVTGPRSNEIRSSLLQGLTHEGFAVIDSLRLANETDALAERPMTLAEERKARGDVLIMGRVEMDPLKLQGRPFFRWTVQFTLIEGTSDRMFGNIIRRGREGHLRKAEAEARAIRAAQQIVGKEMAPELASIILGRESP